MTAAAGNPLSQMADIKGLQPISWWPLAPGWWVLFAVIIVAIVVAACMLHRRRRYRESWRGAALQRLADFDRGLTDGNARAALAELSLTLRQIALQNHSRAECAGLEGRDWLAWLSAHDPHGFAWGDAGACLVSAPYMPPDAIMPADEVRPLLAAARPWVISGAA